MRHPMLLVLLTILAITSCGPSTPEVAEDVARRSVEGGDTLAPVLTDALLADMDDDELSELLTGPLAVDEPLARRWAVGYGAERLGLDGHPSVRLVLPVTDRQGALIARQVVLTREPGEEGFEALWRDLGPILATSAQSFRQVNGATEGQYATVYVAAHRFRHPLREAHRGIPRWLAEGRDARTACPDGGQPTPEAIVDTGGAPYREAIQWRCESGTVVGFSHYTRSVVPAEEVRTVHDVAAVFRRFATRVGQYDDPRARLEHVDSLWSRFVERGEP